MIRSFIMQGIVKPAVTNSERISFYLVCTAVALGCTGLCGWVFDWFTLRSFFFAETTMKVNTALLIVVIGSSVILSYRNHRKIATGLLLAAGVFCTLILYEHISKTDLRIDEWWYADKDTLTGHGSPGRTSLFSAVSLLLLVVIQLLALYKRYQASQLIG